MKLSLVVVKIQLSYACTHVCLHTISSTLNFLLSQNLITLMSFFSSVSNKFLHLIPMFHSYKLLRNGEDIVETVSACKSENVLSGAIYMLSILSMLSSLKFAIVVCIMFFIAISLELIQNSNQRCSRFRIASIWFEISNKEIWIFRLLCSFGP